MISTHVTEAELAEIVDKVELARACIKNDPNCPGFFLEPLVDYADRLLAEVRRLKVVCKQADTDLGYARDWPGVMDVAQDLRGIETQ